MFQARFEVFFIGKEVGGVKNNIPETISPLKA